MNVDGKMNFNQIKKRYRLKRFLEQQEEVLTHLLDENGKDNLLYMAPAARGKTLPPLIATLENKRKEPKRMTIWFVPTIALAHDLLKRVDKTGNYRKIITGLGGLDCMCFTGESVEDKRENKINIAKQGNPDLLIVSPENLKDPAFLAWIISEAEEHLGLMVLDEAHLFDEWGITFRRAYFIISWLIKTLRAQKRKFKIIALSASLPSGKEETVKKLLLFDEEDTFSSRPRALKIGPKIICFSHKNKMEKRKLLTRILKKNIKERKNGEGRKGVLFSPYKKREVARGGRLEWSIENIRNDVVPNLDLKQGECEIYTGDTCKDDREMILSDLHKKRGKIKLLLATSAFGFGVDVDRLNFSTHVQVPEDIDRLYQEISRCSRRPMQGVAQIFYNSHEVAVQTKRCMGTFTYQTVRDYLGLLGIRYIRKGNKTLNLRRVLRKSDRTFKNQRSAQMSADKYFDHAFEAIMFLFRKDIVELRPLRETNFPKGLAFLRRAFEKGKSSGYRKIPYKKYQVFLPSVKFPIKVKKNMSWPKIERAVEIDKKVRGKRTEIFRKMGRNTVCHWKLIADHYNLDLENNRGKIVERCNHCNACKKANASLSR
jgi:superfamily II DNA/RNA helicase